MPYKPKTIEKAYYSITEVAEMLELSPSLLRFWENQFSALNPKKGKKGNRMYTPKDIELIKKLKLLIKDQGFTLKGAQMALKKKESIEQTETPVIQTIQPDHENSPKEINTQSEPSVKFNKTELAEKLVRIRMGLAEIIKQI